MSRVPVPSWGIYGAGFLVTLACILGLNHGRFCYALDDPYIHLALAGNIFHGTYGLHPGIASAPASSILWPFLLAPFSFLSFFQWTPLVFNAFFSLLTLFVFHAVLEAPLMEVPEPRRRLLLSFGGALLVPALNLWGLTFWGMEHALQIFLSVLLIQGLIRAEKGVFPPWLGPVLILGSLVRYENLALSVPALFFLLFRGQRRPVFVWGFMLLFSLLSFSLFLLHLGLDGLPSSVLWKSDLAGGPSAGALLSNLAANFHHRQGWVLAAAGAAALLGARETGRGLGLFGAAAATLHLAFGALGRYELYLFAALLALNIHLHGAFLARAARLWTLRRIAAVLLVFALTACGPYFKWSLVTPLAANNIYEQHLQLRRFVDQCWRAPVAAGDIGVLSFRAQYPVVDLGGLDDRRLRALLAAQNAAAVDSLVCAKGARLAFLYREFFRALPSTWIPVAELSLGKPRISPAGATVTFFAVDGAAAAEAAPLLTAFGPTLPPGVSLRLIH